jgi:AraC family transcriptional regulator, ethanolamine operon transcriptional activator
MARIVYRDFDEFADAIHGVSGRVVPTARPRTDWWLQVVARGRLVIQQLQAGGPATFAGDGAARTITIGLPTTSRAIHIDGDPLDTCSFVLARAGQPFTVCSREVARWVGITVPTDHVGLPPELLRAVTSSAFGRRSHAHARAPAAEIERALMLVVRTCEDDRSAQFLEATAVRAAEEELMSVAAAILEHAVSAVSRHVGRPRLPRARIVARALALMEESAGQPVFVADLCRAARVSERTLRNVFQEYFGVGPMRLLKVRQLSEVRAALMAAAPGTQTIASIAGRFGVWDLGAFTRNYKALYGETPSATLQRAAPPRRRDSTSNATWIRYAMQRFRDDPASR